MCMYVEEKKMMKMKMKANASERERDMIKRAYTNYTDYRNSLLSTLKINNPCLRILK